MSKEDTMGNLRKFCLSGITMHRLAVIVAVTVFLSALTTHASAQWTLRAAPDPYIRSVAVFANTPVAGSSTLILSTLTNGMYKGVDNGAGVAWQTINQGLPTLRIFTSNAPDTNTIYAATDGAGIYKTTDGGATWTPLNGSGNGALGCKVVRTITRSGSTTLYAGTACRYNSGMYVSTDSGATWARMATATLPDNVRVLSVFLSGSLMMLGTMDHGIFKSTDTGATFATANTGLGNGMVNSVTTNAAGTASLVAHVIGYGVYRSIDTGATWTLSNTGLPSGFVALAGISKIGTSTLYICTDKQGIYRSTNGGANWSIWGSSGASGDTAFARNVSADPTAANKYFIGTFEGMVRTVDNGNSFSMSRMGGGGQVNAIRHDRLNPAVAYLATASPVKITNIYASDYDAPGVVIRIGSGITGAANEGVIYQDPLNAAVLYATTNNHGIFKSSTGGSSWIAINNGLPSMIGNRMRLAIDPNNTQIMYLGIQNGLGVYKSTSGGASWSASNNGLATDDARSIQHLAIDDSNTATVYVATDGGLYKSTDSGSNWVLKYSAVDGGGKLLPIGHVRLDPSNQQNVFISANHREPSGALSPSAGLHKSIDGGTTWSNVFAGNPVSNMRVLTNGSVYLGLSADVSQPGVYRSMNGGTTWQAYSGGLQGSDIKAFGVKENKSALLSLSLENGFYTAPRRTPTSGNLLLLLD
jgi:photosystem II stability/assembly factor-like uncharacterized protein